MKKFAFKNILIVFILLCASFAQAMEVPESLQKVKGIHKNDERVFISGLPAKDDYNNFAKAGVETVINLMADSQNKDYNNEAELVKQAGIKYIYIPVDWNNPTIANVDSFFEVMKINKNKKILIHCFSNFRASSFYYLYLKTQSNSGSEVKMSEIMKPWGDVDKVFSKYPIWKELMENVESKYK